MRAGVRSGTAGSLVDIVPQSSLERLFRRAAHHHGRGLLEDAVTAWRAILVEHPDYLPALNNLGVALRRLDRVAESEAVLRAGLERHPHNPDLWISLGQTLHAWDLPDAALDAFARAVALDPRRAQAHYAAGLVQLERDRAADARAAFEAALAAEPGHAPSLSALAEAMAAEGDAAGALEQHRRAVAADPDNAAARTRLGMALLAADDWAEGFREYDWRWRTGALPDPGLPLWEGGPLDGRTLLVRAEQGLAETLQFVRLLRDIPQGGRPGEIVLECQPELHRMLNATRWLGAVVPRGETLPPADVWAPLLTLPRLIGLRPEDLSDAGPWLRPDPAALAPWRARLPEGLPIGISWSGGAPLLGRRRNAVPLNAFRPLAEISGVTLVSLQKGEGRREIADCGFPVLDLGAELDEDGAAFTDTAAVIASLPLVISADTPVARLAGALGKPAWTVLDVAADWVWGREGDSTPWFPSMELHRRRRGEAWHAVFERLAGRIGELCQAVSGAPGRR